MFTMKNKNDVLEIFLKWKAKLKTRQEGRLRFSEQTMEENTRVIRS